VVRKLSSVRHELVNRGGKGCYSHGRERTSRSGKRDRKCLQPSSTQRKMKWRKLSGTHLSSPPQIQRNKQEFKNSSKKKENLGVSHPVTRNLLILKGEGENMTKALPKPIAKSTQPGKSGRWDPLREKKSVRRHWAAGVTKSSRGTRVWGEDLCEKGEVKTIVFKEI